MSIVAVHGPNTWGDAEEEEPEGFQALAAGGEGEGEGAAEPESYDPADYTVAEVQAYVEANPDQRDEVWALESEGKNRTTLIAWLEAFEA